jgi:hypothetical protein
MTLRFGPRGNSEVQLMSTICTEPLEGRRACWAGSGGSSTGAGARGARATYLVHLPSFCAENFGVLQDEKCLLVQLGPS